jgi:Peptide-N-glycosidase F, C terminal
LAALPIGVVACSSKPLDGGASESQAGMPTGGASADPTTLPILEEVEISSDASAEHFQHADAEADFGQEPVTRAVLGVTLASPCFPFAGWADPGVPSGQRWPTDCDAFDRTIKVTLDEAEPPSEDAPALELLRAITPFGGPLEVETDVTDVVNGLPGVHRVGIRIDTWSDADGLVSGSNGRWIASVDLTLWRGASPRRVLAVMPLVLTSQTAADAAPLTFEVPEDVGSARIEYRVTGHGGAFGLGCSGPAEEFCRRTHELSLDGEPLPELTPWRDDCADLCTITQNDSDYGPATYCAENPCGDPRSVRAPRANWCPGSMTPPFVIEAPALQIAGQHQLTQRIPELAKGGLWTVSATYFAFE